MSGQGQKQEYGDLMLILIIVGVIFFAILAEYFFYYYLYFWRGICITLGYAIKSLPPFINEIFFFWVSSDINKVAERVVDIALTNNNSYFQKNINVYDKVNIFFNSLFRPYLFIMFLYTAFVIVSKKNFNRVYLFRKHPKNKIKTVDSKLNVTSIDQLLAQEARIWPSVQLMVNNHPEFIGDLDTGVWAMSKRPETFVKDFNLLDEIVDEYDNKNYKLNEEKTFKIFNAQMGKPWVGFNKLNNHEKQIFAIMAPKMLRKTAESKEIVSAIASSYSTGKKTFKEMIFSYKEKNKVNRLVNTTIEKYKNDEKIKKLINRHFYKKTLFAALLEGARDDGVLATSEFLWLKTKDRELWYMLNNVGRKSAFVECSAPWSHFLAEKLLERKVANPMIANAMIALDQYLYDTSYKYIRIYQPASDLEE